MLGIAQIQKGDKASRWKREEERELLLLFMESPRPRRDLESNCHKTLEHGILAHLDSRYAALDQGDRKRPRWLRESRQLHVGSPLLPAPSFGCGPSSVNLGPEVEPGGGCLLNRALQMGSAGECPVGGSSR